MLSGLDLVPLSKEVIELATTAGPPSLRSLDAIHLASALSLEGAPLTFVTYDARLRSAADEAGLETVVPS